MIARPSTIAMMKLWLFFLVLCLSATGTSSSSVRGTRRSKKSMHQLVNRLNSFQEEESRRFLENESLEQQKRRFLEHMNQEEDAFVGQTRIITVECQSKPLFLCPSCQSALEKEQESVISHALSNYPNAKVVSQTQKIFNAVFLELPYMEDETADASLSQLGGVKRVLPHRFHQIVQIAAEDTAAYIGGGIVANATNCLTGKNIIVGIIDTGIDYTHEAFGGPGTEAAYSSAYGLSANDTANTQRDGLFPTERVIAGHDFVGEGSDVWEEDDDPIDRLGHGTAVASAILAVAPDAKLVAAKSCTSREGACPDFAILAGIEFLLDPNQDGSMDDKVDIINLSLGSIYSSPYYETVSAAMENAFALGVLPITAVGNSLNIPYVAGHVGTSPNVISVGATSNPNDNITGIMESYSSRGPGENNYLKPDISAPSYSLMALAGSGSRYESYRGTSFSCPLVSGAAALMMERCPECSPFAIKSILMNNAVRDIRYRVEDNRKAPVTLMGSGELRVDKALEADFWAYSIEDVQPSLSLGLIDAAVDVVYKRTIVVTNLESLSSTLRINSEFRDPADEESGAVTIQFDKDKATFNGAECNEELRFEVSFSIHAALAPPNYMVSGGPRGLDPELLDKNEFDGHIVITDETGKEIALPFHMLLRQASYLQVAPGSFLPTNDGDFSYDFSVTNYGAGAAQVDSFDVLATGVDQPEGGYGSGSASEADMRTIGYRTLPLNKTGCDHLVEFSFQTWERSRHVGLAAYFVEIQTDPTTPVYRLFSPAAPNPRELYITNPNGVTSCTGFSPDHCTNSANTIVRACSNDLGLTEPGIIYASFALRTYRYTSGIQFEQEVGPIAVPFPRGSLAAPSYDVASGETLNSFTVSGTIGPSTVGVQLVTNSYRNNNSTGAATRNTETLFILQEGTTLEVETTPDTILPLPIARDFAGPRCNWKEKECQLSSNAQTLKRMAPQSAETKISIPGEGMESELVPLPENGEPFPLCDQVEAPRMVVPTHVPSTQPSSMPTGPTASPSTSTPTIAPLTVLTESPTAGSGSPGISHKMVTPVQLVAIGAFSILFVALAF
jgi:subtilisin family serine protease